MWLHTLILILSAVDFSISLELPRRRNLPKISQERVRNPWHRPSRTRQRDFYSEIQNRFVHLDEYSGYSSDERDTIFFLETSDRQTIQASMLWLESTYSCSTPTGFYYDFFFGKRMTDKNIFFLTFVPRIRSVPHAVLNPRPVASAWMSFISWSLIVWIWVTNSRGKCMRNTPMVGTLPFTTWMSRK